jgi:GTPase
MTDSNSITTKTAVAVAGSADSGKSSFISVMVYKILDNGNGSARELVATHNHEIQKGKTSDISTRVLEIPDKNQALTIIDLCGQADYFKTTAFGLSGYYPDYSFLIISANNGITPMTIQHMRVLVSLNIPVVIIVTRIDITPQNKYKETIDNVKKMILNMCGKNSKIEIMNNPYDEKGEMKLDESEELKNNIKIKTISQISEFQERQLYYPVISMSNKTGYLVNLMRDIMTDLPTRDVWLSNKFVVNIFKKSIIEQLDENYVKVLINNVMCFSEIQKCIKFTLGEITNKAKPTNTNKEQTLKNIVSKFLPTWIFGGSEEPTKKLIDEYISKNTCEFTEEQKKECNECINHILQKYENLKENIEIETIEEDINKYLLNKIDKSFDFTKDEFINVCANKVLFEHLKKTNVFTQLIENLYKLFSDCEFANSIKKIENKQYSSVEKIKGILPNMSKFYESQDFENVIFKKHQELEGNVFYIDNCYNPPGIGLVITGINRGSDIQTGNKLLIGPINKEFYEFRVKSMHNNNRETTEKLENHSRGTIAMALVKKGEVRRNQIKKGMVVISNQIMSKNVCFRFKAAIKIAAKSVTVKSGYTPVLHIGTIRQPARIILDPEENNGQECVGFNAKNSGVAIVTFKFKCTPEYIEPYTVFLIRNGDIHGIGVILSILPMSQDSDAKPDDHKGKNIK